MTALLSVGMLAVGAVGGWQTWLGERAEATPRVAAIGQPVRAGALAATVTGFRRLADGHAGVNSPSLPMSGPGMPMAMGPVAGAVEKGQERIAVRVSLVNTGRDARPYGVRDLTLTSAGRPVPLLAATRSDLLDGSLAAGFRVEATVQFVVKEGTAPLELRVAGSPTRVLLDSRGSVPAAPGTGHGH